MEHPSRSRCLGSRDPPSSAIGALAFRFGLFRALLLGPPGVGKGTQAGMLARSHGACHLSTGDVFRVAATIDAGNRSPVLRRAIEMMTHGELVTDDTVGQLVRERIGCLRCPGGFLLDGFPRTVPAGSRARCHAGG